MSAATDIHFKLMKWENRSFQQALMERIDTYEAALLGLTEMVAANHGIDSATNRGTQSENRCHDEAPGTYLTSRPRVS